MKEYDLIVIGTGSGTNYVYPMMEANPDLKVAVVDKDEPGGICLTRGCIPSKMLLYPAELARDIQKAHTFGIQVNIESIDFKAVMERMRSSISKDIEAIKKGYSYNHRIDYYREAAEFVAPYTLKAGEETITAKMIFLSIGSKPAIPLVRGLEELVYLTSDSVLSLDDLPKSLAIIGGGYIAAEYGHFFSSMGSKVTIIGRNPFFLPNEEPEISILAKRMMSDYMDIFTNYQVLEVTSSDAGKNILARNRETSEEIEIVASEILVATGRSPNTDVLKPEKAGIETDALGWIKVDKHMETSSKNVWAFGDATGKYLFKHVANHESTVVYYNAVLGKKARADYHAVPHAVFSYPEIAGVGMSEARAIEDYGEQNIIIGFYRFDETAKGIAMALQDEFVKIILETETQKILGAHIIGPHASVLIHEIIPVMYTADQNADPIMHAMDIHPSLSEVIKRAFYSRMHVSDYHMIMQGLGLEENENQ
ncbi:dihydrolipoyl dehydrogenase [Methanolobus halotolerans]|uniref:Dihydrolipoyl dehydrogenase n=1 Tax=Methanolobus halotolerans TaxID=2052935 RepID=A0A4E0QXA8_9EURY|nr:dihydrolipoyl dehydrogenase [Methanolobus halotolerans]TGC07382.1 dihydrolipoyl dehydrogenase [Methanolobus halotolerans]